MNSMYVNSVRIDLPRRLTSRDVILLGGPDLCYDR